MLPLVLFLPRVILVISWIFLGLLSVIFIFPFASIGTRSFMNQHWSRLLMRVCGVKILCTGEPRMHGAVMWVANHVSWVDIFVLNSTRPTAFIAKSDIRRWPVIGWLVAGAGTIFIDRGNRHVIRSVSYEMKARFDEGQAVGLFPEGTTSSGADVAPFHSSLFEAAISAHADIQPVALRFFHRGRRSDYVAFVGEQNLVQNLWCLLSTTGVVVQVVFLPVIAKERCELDGRSKVAAHAHRAIRHAVIS